jgi:uncharacterized membrane protein YidH (DUF202 family)
VSTDPLLVPGEGYRHQGPDPALAEAEGFEGPDAGLAAERTDLAWSRSGLALGACGVVVLRGLPAVTGHPSQPVIGAAILVLGGITWLLGRWSAHRRRPRAGQARMVARWSDLAPAAYGTAAVGLAGLVLAFLRPD